MLCKEGNILFNIVRDALRKVPAKLSKDSKASMFVWYDNLREGDFYSTLLPWQVVNRIPESNLMCRKAPFIRLMQRMQMFRPVQYQFVPKSYVLPLQNEAFVAAVSKHDRMHIVKPDGGSLGYGIKVLQKDDDFTPDNHLAIAQEYIDSYTIDDTKFDLRVYVLVSSLDPLRIYVYRDGVARFCSEKSTANSVYSQLTNTAVNKQNPDVKVESITKTIKQVFECMKSRGVDTATIWKKIDRAVVLTVISALKFMRDAEKDKCPQIGYPRCFQVFGFDVLLDKQLEPVIMEVNYRPSLAADTPDEKKMKVEMLSEAIQIAVPLKAVQALLNDKTVNYAENEWRKFFLDKQNVVKSVKTALTDKKRLVNFHQVYPSAGECQKLYDDMIDFVVKLPTFVNGKYRLPCLLKDPKKKPVRNETVTLSPDTTPVKSQTQPSQKTQTDANNKKSEVAEPTKQLSNATKPQQTQSQTSATGEQVPKTQTKPQNAATTAKKESRQPKLPSQPPTAQTSTRKLDTGKTSKPVPLPAKENPSQQKPVATTTSDSKKPSVAAKPGARPVAAKDLSQNNEKQTTAKPKGSYDSEKKATQEKTKAVSSAAKIPTQRESETKQNARELAKQDVTPKETKNQAITEIHTPPPLSSECKPKKEASPPQTVIEKQKTSESVVIPTPPPLSSECKPKKETSPPQTVIEKQKTSESVVIPTPPPLSNECKPKKESDRPQAGIAESESTAEKTNTMNESDATVLRPNQADSRTNEHNQGSVLPPVTPHQQQNVTAGPTPQQSQSPTPATADATEIPQESLPVAAPKPSEAKNDLIKQSNSQTIRIQPRQTRDIKTADHTRRTTCEPAQKASRQQVKPQELPRMNGAISLRPGTASRNPLKCSKQLDSKYTITTRNGTITHNRSTFTSEAFAESEQRHMLGQTRPKTSDSRRSPKYYVPSCEYPKVSHVAVAPSPGGTQRAIISQHSPVRSSSHYHVIMERQRVAEARDRRSSIKSSVFRA